MNQPVATIELTRKKASLIALPFRIIAVLVGIFGIIMSICLFVSIIGIPIAIFMWIGSAGAIYLAIGKQKVQCPHCNYNNNYVTKGALNVTCRKCKQLAVIEWKN